MRNGVMDTRDWQIMWGMAHKYDVKLTITPEALRAIAKKAIERKTGARGLRAIMEEILMEWMYELPDKKDIAEIVIDEKVITDGEKPKLLKHKEETKKSA